jgi:signal transduction histidine kinase
MNNISAHPLLEQLAGIQQPLTASWWPPAPVWWLSFIVLLLLIIISLHLWRKYKKVRYEALAELIQISHNYQRNTDHSQLAMDISILLRCVALAKYPAAEVAGLNGDEWLGFLDQHGNTSAYTRGCGALLAQAPYQAKASFNADELLQLAKHWIKLNT